MAQVKILDRSIFSRILGIPATKLPADPGCWSYANGVITVDLARAKELTRPGGGLRVEGDGIPLRVLIVRDSKGEYLAYQNRCSHLGHRRLDPVPGTDTVQCCSVNKSTYNESGQCIHGPGKKPLRQFPVAVDGNRLTVSVG
ncbi:MAG: Rieske (2Fe-2S) protein [Thermodesulfobacteriota bacterium]